MDIDITWHSVAEYHAVIQVPDLRAADGQKRITDAAEATARRLRPDERLLDLSWTAPDGTFGGRRW